MTTPLDDLAPLEAALRAALFGKFKGGIFGTIREPPAAVVVLAAAGNADAIIASPWWEEIWVNALADLERHLLRISREAGFAAFREITPPRERSAARDLLESYRADPKDTPLRRLQIASCREEIGQKSRQRAHQRRGLPEREAGRLADKLAKRRAAALVRSIRKDTEAGLRVIVKTIQEMAAAGAEKLADELAARLGPTRAQARRIRRWERVERLKGTDAAAIRLGALSRSRNAIRSRADSISGHHFAAAVGESRMTVFRDGAMLVHSQDQADGKVDQDCLDQTRQTKANPVPAGDPYVNATFPGPVPYHRG